MRNFTTIILLIFGVLNILTEKITAQNVQRSGIVQTQDGKPVHGIQIYIDELKPVTSNKKGKFVFDLPTEQVQPNSLYIKKIGWAIAGWHYNADADMVSITITPSKVILTGKVENNKRQPVANTKVGIKGTFIETTTNSEGRFSMIVPPGVEIERKNDFFMLDGMALPKESLIIDPTNGAVLIRTVVNQVFEVTFKNESNIPLGGANLQIGNKFYETSPVGVVKINNQIVTKNDKIQIDDWDLISQKYDAKAKSIRVTVRQKGAITTNNNAVSNNFDPNFNPIIYTNPNLPKNQENSSISYINDSSETAEADTEIFNESIISHITLDEYVEKSQEHFTEKEHAINQIVSFKELLKSQKNLTSEDKEKAKTYLKYLYQSLGDAEKHLQIRDMAQDLIEQLQGALIEKDETFTEAVQAMELEAAAREESFRKALERQESEFHRKVMIYTSLIVLLVGLAFLMVILMRRTHKHKKEVLNKNTDLEKTQRQVLESNEELKQRNEEIRAQSEHLRRLNEEVTRHNRNMTAGIRYAQTIQSAILPANDEMDAKFSDFFILYKPKDIVSGDFYWMAHSEDQTKIFIAAIDCTGHGVPGAFMSMIGTNILNTIINNEHTYAPKEIIEQLNQKIRVALKQEKKINDDGMDVCLCLMEKTEKQASKITFTGAKRPLYYVTGLEKNIHALKGDNKSVGGRQRPNKHFSNQELTLNQGDMLYLTTDGLVDQSSPKHNKFGTKMLLEVLEKNASRPLDLQQKILEDALKNHQQSEEQRDDITLIGIKI